MNESEAGYRMRNKVLSTVIKVTTLILVLCAVFILVKQQGINTQTELRIQELEREKTAVEQEIQRIQEKIDSAGTDKGIADAAHDKLGLVGPGEVEFRDVGN